jgi:antitoxin MazE
MSTTVQKWGNSLGIRVPKAIAEQLHLEQGSKIELDASNGVLTVRLVRPSRRRSKYTFKELWGNYKGPSPYLHLDRDPPVGKELL